MPNSNRQIEPELMRRLATDNLINDISSRTNTKGLEFLESHQSVGSVSESDQYASDEMHRFWLGSINIKKSIISGREPFSGEMMNPSIENVLLSDISNSMPDLMVKYYNAAYEDLEFRKVFGEGPENSIIIGIRINKFGRCRIGSETFGSALSTRHIKSSFIRAKFVTKDGSVDCYPGQVQYFFTHTVDLPDGPSEHYLAYVRWYNHTDSRYYFSVDDDEQTCNVELWRSSFYPESRDCIIPVHHILERFVPVEYKTSSRRNAVEYLAINPINRKYHIR